MAFPRIPPNIGTLPLGADIGGGEGGGGRGGASGISCCILSEVYMFMLRLDCDTLEVKKPPSLPWWRQGQPPKKTQYCVRVHGELAYSAGMQCITLGEMEESVGAEPGSLTECPKTEDMNSDSGIYWSMNNGPGIGQDCSDWSIVGMWSKMTDCGPCDEDDPYGEEVECDCSVNETKEIDSIICTNKCSGGGWEEAIFDSKAFKDAFTQIKRITCESDCEQTDPPLREPPEFESLAQAIGSLGEFPELSSGAAAVKFLLPSINMCK